MPSLRPALVAALIVAATTPASALGYDDAGYLAYADRMQERLDHLWDGRRGVYRAGEGGADSLINANLLLTHSVARGSPRPGVRRPRGAIAHVIMPSRQSPQPDPGPTLAVELARGGRWARIGFAARMRVH
jgi:hypothetical protein